MNVNDTEQCTEYTFDANDADDRVLYAALLWTGRHSSPWIAEALQRNENREEGRGEQSPGPRKRFPLPEKKGFKVWESTWDSGRYEVRTPCSAKRVPERVLRATGTQASDWQERQSARPRQSQVQGAAEGTWPLALQRLCEILQSDGEEINSFVPDHSNRGNTK